MGLEFSRGIVRSPTKELMVGENAAGQTVHGALQVADVHGKWFEANYRGKAFEFLATAVTVPAVASGLVSVFTLYNPPSSGVVAELIRASIGQVLATTVVNAFGWYSSSPNLGTDYVVRGGLALIHPGETIIPAARGSGPYTGPAPVRCRRSRPQ